MNLGSATDVLKLLDLAGPLSGSDATACCVSLYANPAVRWVFGDELHPGGQDTTRRALELISLGPGTHLLDVAAGRGDAAILAAREFGCTVVGIDHGAAGIADARQAAQDAGVADRVRFRVADAEALPFEDGSFDAVLCECSLCLFADRHRALSEIRRILRPGGRFAVSDVLADHGSAPMRLSGALPATACIETALSRAELGQLLYATGFEVTAEEPCTQQATKMAERVHDRLRGARIVAAAHPALAQTLTEAIAMAKEARAAIDRGALDYAILAATRRGSPGDADRLMPDAA